jgi:hypothetical protein
MSVKCYKCCADLALSVGQNTARNEECPQCYANIHSCMMCEFYDTTAYNECKEPTADRILEKEKANFCDHFKLSGGAGAVDQKDSLLSAAEALFKK